MIGTLHLEKELCSPLQLYNSTSRNSTSLSISLFFMLNMCSTYSIVMQLCCESPQVRSFFGVDICNTLASTASIKFASGIFLKGATVYIGPSLDLPNNPRSDLAKQDEIAEELHIIRIWA